MEITYDAATDRYTITDLRDREAGLLLIGCGDLSDYYRRSADEAEEEGLDILAQTDRSLSSLADKLYHQLSDITRCRRSILHERSIVQAGKYRRG